MDAILWKRLSNGFGSFQMSSRIRSSAIGDESRGSQDSWNTPCGKCSKPRFPPPGQIPEASKVAVMHSCCPVSRLESDRERH